MARYIIIDQASGYIWGDSADLNGRVFNGTPLEFAQALDRTNGEHDRRYYELTYSGLHARGYHVYRVDVGGSEIVPVVTDGTDQSMIDAVERDGQYLGFIAFERP
jgi:hypothetical protein